MCGPKSFFGLFGQSEFCCPESGFTIDAVVLRAGRGSVPSVHHGRHCASLNQNTLRLSSWVPCKGLQPPNNWLPSLSIQMEVPSGTVLWTYSETRPKHAVG